jgi:hypothetical protein
MVKGQSTYFKNSGELKKELDKLTLPPNALLFTYDAVSIYTIIDTEDCIACIKEYLLKPTSHYRFAPMNPRAIVEAMSLVMRNNRMSFGDLVVHQIKGIAMGMLPAPTIANLFVAIFKAEQIVPIIGMFIMFLRRFIDDGFSVWIHDPDPTVDDDNWRLFQMIVNAMGLAWEFTSRSQKVTFMDLKIKIEDRRIVTLLYAKPMALYLYIPPNLSHAPGILTGLVYGQVLRVYQLCSWSKDINTKLAAFYRRLRARGYHPCQLLPLFKKAINNACTYLSRTDDEQRFITKEKKGASKQRVFFHLPFHPQPPPSAKIQHIWHNNVSSPLGEPMLHHLKKSQGTLHPHDADR